MIYILHSSTNKVSHVAFPEATDGILPGGKMNGVLFRFGSDGWRGSHRAVPRPQRRQLPPAGAPPGRATAPLARDAGAAGAAARPTAAARPRLCRGQPLGLEHKAAARAVLCLCVRIAAQRRVTAEPTPIQAIAF